MPKNPFTHCWVPNHRYVTIVSWYILCRLQNKLTPWRFCPKLWQHRQWRRYVSVKGSWISCVSILLSTTIIAHLPTLLEFTIATVLCWHPIYDLRHHSDVPGYLHGASCGTFPWWSSSCGGWRNEHVVSGARIFRLNYACREVADCTWGTRKLSSNLRKGKGDMLVPRIDIQTIHTKKNSKKGNCSRRGQELFLCTVTYSQLGRLFLIIVIYYIKYVFYFFRAGLFNVHDWWFVGLLVCLFVCLWAQAKKNGEHPHLSTELP